MLSRQHLDAVLVHDAYQLLKDEKQATLHQANTNGCAHSGKDTEASRVGDGLFLALLILLGLPLVSVAAGWLLCMMHRASSIGTHLVDGGNVAAFSDDGFRGDSKAEATARTLQQPLNRQESIPDRLLEMQLVSLHLIGGEAVGEREAAPQPLGLKQGRAPVRCISIGRTSL